MDYTRTDAYAVHPGTGHRLHQQTEPVPTAVGSDDMNQLTWSLMEVLNEAGVTPSAFDPDDPSTYRRLVLALKGFPTEFEAAGAKGDGVTDDSAALQAQINSGKFVVLRPNRVYKAKNLVSILNGGLTCVGGRATILVPPGDDTFGLKINTSYFHFSNIDIKSAPDVDDPGPYNVAGGSTLGSRNGLLMGLPFGTGTGLSGIEVRNVDIVGFNCSGLQGLEVQVGFQFGKRCTLHNIFARDNRINLWFSPRFEYVSVTDCYGYNGFAGIVATAGNNSIKGGGFQNNFQNIQMAAGENDGHGSFIGVSVNHAAAGGLGLYALDIINGMKFIGCMFYYAGITLENCKGIDISHGDIVASPITISGGGKNRIAFNYCPDGLSKTFIGETHTSFEGNQSTATETNPALTLGAVYLQATNPAVWNFTATVDTNLPVTYSSALWWSVASASFLTPSGVVTAPETGLYDVNVEVPFANSGSVDKVLLKATRYTGATVQDTLSAAFPAAAGSTENVVRVSGRMLMVKGDTLKLTLKSATGGGINVVANTIRAVITSVHN